MGQDKTPWPAQHKQKKELNMSPANKTQKVKDGCVRFFIRNFPAKLKTEIKIEAARREITMEAFVAKALADAVEKSKAE